MKRVPVTLLGAGGIGRTLLQQIVSGRANVAERNQIQFDVVAITTRKWWVKDADGLSDSAIMSIVQRRQKPEQFAEEAPPLADVLAKVVEVRGEPGILVDVTAASGMEPTINAALDMGWGCVFANKKPFAGPWETAQRYFHNPMVRHEATVGAGQPIISTLRYMRDISDDIYAIEGQLSGTLGYLCQRMDEGVSFSQGVAEAKAKKYTEPDPREDLGGLDVMRKALIMARLAGWPLEVSDIEVESLYNPALAHLTVPEFMASVVSMDPSMAERVAEAKANGNVLRYIANVDENGGKVGLKAIPADNPFASIKYIQFDTLFNHDEHLVVCGKGAGLSVTAGGVHGDMIDLAREML